jgi:Amt family ammonium transporter
LSKLAGKVAAVTTIAGSSAGITAVVFQSFFHKHYDISFFCNAILAGLVAVTAPCAVIDPWAAFIIGISATFVFYYASKLFLYLQIDDPVGAGPLHGKCVYSLSNTTVGL